MRWSKKVERYWRAFNYYRRMINSSTQQTNPRWWRAHTKMIFFHQLYVRELDYGKMTTLAKR